MNQLIQQVQRFSLLATLVLPLLLLMPEGMAMGQDTGTGRAVSLTFDDLPATRGDLQEMRLITDALLEELVRREAPAIGFVNESKLHTGEEADPSHITLLSSWLEAGMELGNHTYSHVSIDRVPFEEYRREVLLGERVTRPLMDSFGRTLRYFRHTQLRTGPTDSYRRRLNDFLEEEGYTVAPVTLDSDEYIYAYCYDRAKEREDLRQLTEIREEYLRYMEQVFAYYEQLSQDFLGYEPRQILLLHANRLNADALPQLLEMIRSRGYAFISLEEALEDPAYTRPTVQADRGLSWLHRWMLAEGASPPEQPGVSQYIRDLFNSYNNSSQ